MPSRKHSESELSAEVAVVHRGAAESALRQQRIAGDHTHTHPADALVQAFGKVPFLNAIAPTQKDLPFIVAQGVVLLIFVYLGVKAVRSFHPEAVAGAARG